MELKDSAVVGICSSLVFAFTGFITGGALFYAAAIVIVAIIFADHLSLRFRLRDIKRNFTVVSSFSSGQMCPGEEYSLGLKIMYNGRLRHHVNLSLPADPTIEIVSITDGDFYFYPGAVVELSAVFKPLRRGSFSMGPLRVTPASTFFTCSGTVGGDAMPVIVSLPIGTSHLRSNRVLRGARKYASHNFSNVMIEKNHGCDFSNTREYVAGDSVKSIDWTRSGKSGSLIIKEYEGERSMPVMLLIDADSSMDSGGEVSQLDSVIRLAVPIINDLIMNNDKVGIACFSRDDVVGYKAPGMGMEHMAGVKDLLSGLKTVDSGNVFPAKMATLHKASECQKAFREIDGLGILGPVIEETIREYTTNIRSDGFMKALMKSMGSVNSPSFLVIMTNMSMRLTSLLNGIRLARYYGHTVSIVLTPYIWYDEKNLADSEKYFDIYKEVKDSILIIKGMEDVRVIDICPGDTPESVIYQARSYDRMTNIRR
ncbi:hypothetical protein CUJ83_07720 [Methanocella sp. CWC-04]|uniref:DUF58 domain-containing protein n=1 Tax=Methanooceanicella nereidis TaxID=2052831 RepID=A0AAP2W753_9EURY|nr:DUF58 domain-containing protein [Methanocella sp. CWC-04]MCD1294884.1 hypothetical protein [Methanocella sp. CWC-04]